VQGGPLAHVCRIDVGTGADQRFGYLGVVIIERMLKAAVAAATYRMGSSQGGGPALSKAARPPCRPPRRPRASPMMRLSYGWVAALAKFSSALETLAMTSSHPPM
jgi:hypothetical protein